MEVDIWVRGTVRLCRKEHHGHQRTEGDPRCARGRPGLLLALAVLLLRRLPAVLVLKALLGRVRETRDALFLGWIGPMGVAALFYANFSVNKAGVEEA